MSALQRQTAHAFICGNLLSVWVFLCPAGGGPSEGAEAAHQTAEGGTEETSTEGRSQFGDQIQERERK